MPVRRDWMKHCARWASVGSRRTNFPAPTDTDDDFLLHAGSWEHAHLEALGFRVEGDEHYGFGKTIFRSFRRGDENLIVTSNAVFFERYLLATALCARLNLPNKGERIAIFQGVLYGQNHSGEWPTHAGGADPLEDADVDFL